MGTKTCKCCGRELPESEFSRNGFGLMSVCRECVAKKKADAANKKKEIAEKVEMAASNRTLRISEFTPRELMAELKRRGYKWEKMSITIEQYVDYNKI